MKTTETQRAMLETLYSNGFTFGEIEDLCNSNMKSYAVRYNACPTYRKSEKKRVTAWQKANK